MINNKCESILPTNAKSMEKYINLVITSKSIPNSNSSKLFLMYFLLVHAHT